MSGLRISRNALPALGSQDPALISKARQGSSNFSGNVSAVEVARARMPAVTTEPGVEAKPVAGLGSSVAQVASAKTQTGTASGSAAGGARKSFSQSSLSDGHRLLEGTVDGKAVDYPGLLATCNAEDRGKLNDLARVLHAIENSVATSDNPGEAEELQGVKASLSKFIAASSKKIAPDIAICKGKDYKTLCKQMVQLARDVGARRLVDEFRSKCVNPALQSFVEGKVGRHDVENPRDLMDLHSAEALDRRVDDAVHAFGNARDFSNAVHELAFALTQEAKADQLLRNLNPDKAPADNGPVPDAGDKGPANGPGADTGVANPGVPFNQSNFCNPNIVNSPTFINNNDFGGVTKAIDGLVDTVKLLLSRPPSDPSPPDVKPQDAPSAPSPPDVKPKDKPSEPSRPNVEPQDESRGQDDLMSQASDFEGDADRISDLDFDSFSRIPRATVVRGRAPQGPDDVDAGSDSGLKRAIPRPDYDQERLSFNSGPKIPQAKVVKEFGKIENGWRQTEKGWESLQPDRLDPDKSVWTTTRTRDVFKVRGVDRKGAQGPSGEQSNPQRSTGKLSTDSSAASRQKRESERSLVKGGAPGPSRRIDERDTRPTGGQSSPLRLSGGGSTLGLSGSSNERNTRLAGGNAPSRARSDGASLNGVGAGHVREMVSQFGGGGGGSARRSIDVLSGRQDRSVQDRLRNRGQKPAHTSPPTTGEPLASELLTPAAPRDQAVRHAPVSIPERLVTTEGSSRNSWSTSVAGSVRRANETD